MPFKWSKQKSVCGTSVVKRENRRSSHCGDFQFWWTVRGSNPRPRRCERRALPAELTAQIGHFSIKKVAKNGFLRYSILREKSEKSDEKLEGKNGPVMCVHMDANEPTGIVCTWIWPFLAVSANNHFVFKPLVTTIFRVFREPLWYVLWSASEPRWNAPARLVCCLRVDDTSERGVRQQFSAHSNARGAMLNQGIGRVLPCCGSSRKINSGNKIENLKTGRIIDKLALLC